MSQGMPIVSVVIPIYNVSQWIDRGMQNFLSQSLANIEVWLVDDGSTDDSFVKCKDWAQKDGRVHTIRKKNGGAGSARNVGIDAANGKYIYFFDIDDLAKPNLLEYCSKKMDELQVDYIMFGFNMIETDYSKNVLVCNHHEHVILNNKSLSDVFVDEMILCKGGNGFPWNKMYRRDFLNKYHLRFENQRIQQDEVFNLLVYEKLERAYISSEILYDYFIYNKGNTRTRFISDRFDIYVSVREHFEHLIRFWGLNDLRLDNYLFKRFYNSMSETLRFNLFHPNCNWSLKQKRDEIKRVLNHEYSKEAFQKVTPEGFEAKLYRFMYMKRSIVGIQTLNVLFKTMRRFRHL